MTDISLNGSCWDDGPAPMFSGECAPMPPKCELHAGHLGAHRSGRTEWMRNPSSYRQVSQERDDALAELSRARNTIAKAMGARRSSGLSSAELVYAMFRILASYEAGETNDCNCHESENP